MPNNPNMPELPDIAQGKIPVKEFKGRAAVVLKQLFSSEGIEYELNTFSGICPECNTPVERDLPESADMKYAGCSITCPTCDPPVVVTILKDGPEDYEEITS